LAGLLWLSGVRLGKIPAGAEHGDDRRDALVARSRLDRTIVGNLLLAGLARQLGVVNEGLAQGLILFGLGRERVEPLTDMVVLQRLLQAGADVGLGARDGVDLEQLVGIGITVRQRRGIFERCLDQRLAAFAALQEQLGLEPMLRRLGDRVADFLFRAVVEGDSRLFRRSIAVGLVGGGALLRASGEGGGAQGKADGRADQFTLHTGG
jgi:hypothetical protein